MNHGKRFEQDFQKSAEQVMDYTRFNDPGSSFNIHCQGCEKKQTRFAPRHTCDAVGYSFPLIFYFELKSVKGKSIPNKNIVKSEKDKRLVKLAKKAARFGVIAVIVVNFREEGNQTYAISAKAALGHIETETRKSIPLEYFQEHGIRIESRKKRVRYGYDIDRFLKEVKNVFNI